MRRTEAVKSVPVAARHNGVAEGHSDDLRDDVEDGQQAALLSRSSSGRVGPSGRDGDDVPRTSARVPNIAKVALAVLSVGVAYRLGQARAVAGLPSSALADAEGKAGKEAIDSIHERQSFLAESLDELLASSSKNHTNATVAVRTDAHPPILYGHVHMAKTGGTSLNGIFANRFERVCGNKGYSHDAYRDNLRAKKMEAEGKHIRPADTGRGKVPKKTMRETGFEDCDYVSYETGWEWWTQQFGHRKFHGMEMELHVPCRDPVDHLMSQCNYRHRSLDCTLSDEEFYKSIRKCMVFPGRYGHGLKKDFRVKCFDFKQQFTTYADRMAGILQRRRFESKPFVKRETNRARNKKTECIWTNEEAYAKAKKYLIRKYEYYQFCDACMGSVDDITREQETAAGEAG